MRTVGGAQIEPRAVVELDRVKAAGLEVEPREMGGRDVLEQRRDRSGDAWSERVVSDQQRQQIRHRTMVAGRRQGLEIGNARIVAGRLRRHRASDLGQQPCDQIGQHAL